MEKMNKIKPKITNGEPMCNEHCYYMGQGLGVYPKYCCGGNSSYGDSINLCIPGLMEQKNKLKCCGNCEFYDFSVVDAAWLCKVKNKTTEGCDRCVSWKLEE